MPSEDKADVDALTALELVTIVIDCTLAPNEPIVPEIPPIVAVQVDATPVASVPKLTVPKSARGRMPPEDEGASAIHSAEERWALFTFAEA